MFATHQQAALMAVVSVSCNDGGAADQVPLGLLHGSMTMMCHSISTCLEHLIKSIRALYVVDGVTITPDVALNHEWVLLVLSKLQSKKESVLFAGRTERCLCIEHCLCTTPDCDCALHI